MKFTRKNKTKKTTTMHSSSVSYSSGGGGGTIVGNYLPAVLNGDGSYTIPNTIKVKGNVEANRDVVAYSQFEESTSANTLSNLYDVTITNPQHQQILQYNVDEGKWVNATIQVSGGGSGTSVDLTNYYTKKEVDEQIEETTEQLNNTESALITHVNEPIHISSVERANWNTKLSSNGGSMYGDLMLSYNDRNARIVGESADVGIEIPLLGIGYNNGATIEIGGGAYQEDYTIELKGKTNVEGDLLASGEVCAYSDRRLKTDVETLGNRGYIAPHTFLKDGRKQIGFVAQEMQEKYPELVREHNGYLTINYSQYTAVLEAQIMELNERIKRLEEMINGTTR